MDLQTFWFSILIKHCKKTNHLTAVMWNIVFFFKLLSLNGNLGKMLADHFPFRKQLSENCCLFFNENGEKAKDFSWLRCLKESHLRTPRDDTTEWGGKGKKQCMQNSKNSPLNPDLLSILSSGLIWCILFNFQPSDSEWMSCNWCSCAEGSSEREPLVCRLRATGVCWALTPCWTPTYCQGVTENQHFTV